MRIIGLMLAKEWVERAFATGLQFSICLPLHDHVVHPRSWYFLFPNEAEKRKKDADWASHQSHAFSYIASSHYQPPDLSSDLLEYTRWKMCDDSEMTNDLAI